MAFAGIFLNSLHSTGQATSVGFLYLVNIPVPIMHSATGVIATG